MNDTLGAQSSDEFSSAGSEQKTLPGIDAVTEDLRLPDGSTVIQCILHPGEEGDDVGHLEFRCITIGADRYDPLNPAHRFLNAVADRIEEITAEINGGKIRPLANQAAIEQRLREIGAMPSAAEVAAVVMSDAAPSSSDPAGA